MSWSGLRALAAPGNKSVVLREPSTPNKQALVIRRGLCLLPLKLKLSSERSCVGSYSKSLSNSWRLKVTAY